MLTDRDIVTAVIAADLDPATLRVEDVMTTDLVTAREDDVLDILAQELGLLVATIDSEGQRERQLRKSAAA